MSKPSRLFISFITVCFLLVIPVLISTGEGADISKIPNNIKASFDCNKAVTNIERSICSNEHLALADFEMGKLYRNVYSLTSKAGQIKIKKWQRQWMRYRNEHCSDGHGIDKCLMRKYKERIRELIQIQDAIQQVVSISIPSNEALNSDAVEFRIGIIVENLRHDSTMSTMKVLLSANSIPEETRNYINGIIFNDFIKNPDFKYPADSLCCVNHENYNATYEYTVLIRKELSGELPETNELCALYHYSILFKKKQGGKAGVIKAFHVSSKGVLINNDPVDVKDWSSSNCRGADVYSNRWNVWRIDGKGSGVSHPTQNKQADVLDNYEDNVLSIHYDLKWIKEHGKENTFKLEPVAKHIGNWNGHDVYEVTEKQFGMIQLIIKRADRDYRIFYSVWPPEGTLNDSSTLIKSSKIGDILTSDISVYRHIYHEEFLLDSESRMPVKLK